MTASRIFSHSTGEALKLVERPSIQEIYEWLGCFALCLRTTNKKVRLTGRDGPLALPTVFDLPWTSPGFSEKVAIPFSVPSSQSNGLPLENKDSWLGWLNFTTLHMTDPTFLEEGEWCGYYAYKSSILPQFDPPMRNIKFYADPSQQANETYTISAVGRDAVGKFVLRGQISRFDGAASLRKTYAGAHSWTWSCQMTPFGIFGAWSSRYDQRILGWLWLWKSSWTDGIERGG